MRDTEDLFILKDIPNAKIGAQAATAEITKQ